MRNRKLLKNKPYSLLLIKIGALSVLIGYDATFFVFSLIIGGPLFFAKENWIMEGTNDWIVKKNRWDVYGETLSAAQKRLWILKNGGMRGDVYCQ